MAFYIWLQSSLCIFDYSASLHFWISHLFVLCLFKDLWIKTIRQLSKNQDHMNNHRGSKYENVQLTPNLVHSLLDSFGSNACNQLKINWLWRITSAFQERRQWLLPHFAFPVPRPSPHIKPPVAHLMNTNAFTSVSSSPQRNAYPRAYTSWTCPVQRLLIKRT